jgi:aspartate racemase
VREHSGLPVVHIADAVVHELRESQFLQGTVGVLATRGTLISGFYQKRLHAAGYRVLTPMPEAQAANVDRAIGEAKAGCFDDAGRSGAV